MRLTFFSHAAVRLESGAGECVVGPFLDGDPLTTFRPREPAPHEAPDL